MKKLCFITLFFSIYSFSQQIALLKYNGGGDWYANPTSLPNLIKYCNATINTHLDPKPATVTPSSSDLFSYPLVHLTGHGNIVFDPEETTNLQKYLEAGGFLHIDDNYGLNQYVLKEIKKLFPNVPLTELPANHVLFQKPFLFSNGLPKIHEHDGKRPQAFGVFVKNRLVLLYTYECDLGDGWEDPEVNNDPPEIREKALKMGANIIYYVFSN
ncbi:DUF4159 domain-containing protein [Flavobacterium crassostreae]|uniref:DUF4159 domain-containing protein n=1 Tax=Flavobacterium crassostreae TaxID=1763534 RepID=A0A1B9DYV8_9FLAO|nr:DUF4159 domain-containing protein [Flavobacterium crassostreae]OCB74882.1 hypothetical protein LPBF_09735 [Flavobacterium crassostreae]